MRAPLIRTPVPACCASGPAHSEGFREAALSHMQRIESDLCKLRQSFGLPPGQPTSLAMEQQPFQPHPALQATPPQINRWAQEATPPVLRPPVMPMAQYGVPPAAVRRQDLSPALSTISSVRQEQERSELATNCEQQAWRCAPQPMGVLTPTETHVHVGSTVRPMNTGMPVEPSGNAEAESKDRVMQRVFGSPLAFADMNRQVQALNSSIAALRRDSEEKERRWAMEREELTRKLAEVQRAGAGSRKSPQSLHHQDAAQNHAHKLPARWDWTLPVEPASGRQLGSMAHEQVSA
mmetsp:Transcript_43022/g.78212  ORF Transcript_43022/g.78212 Transcript_43022/m.78212 type:complete len:293 (-) Transcript_43022:38-916(-)